MSALKWTFRLDVPYLGMLESLEERRDADEADLVIPQDHPLVLLRIIWKDESVLKS